MNKKITVLFLTLMMSGCASNQTDLFPLSEAQQISASNQATDKCTERIDELPIIKKVKEEIFQFYNEGTATKSGNYSLKKINQQQKIELKEFLLINSECRKVQVDMLVGVFDFQARIKRMHLEMDKIYLKLLSDEITIDEANFLLDQAYKNSRSRSYKYSIEREDPKIVLKILRHLFVQNTVYGFSIAKPSVRVIGGTVG